MTIEPDFAALLPQLFRDAEAGDSERMADLALSFRLGLGLCQDEEKAIYWYRRAADSGNAKAMFFLADILSRKNDDREISEAVIWYRRAAEAGDAEAMCRLGVAIAEGAGTTPNDVEAAHWLQAAATAGSSGGMYYLGSLYFYGRGMEQDFNRALHWYNRAAEKNNADAMHSLSVLANHFGDAFTGMGWLKRAAERGHLASMRDLGIACLKGKGMSIDLQSAEKWLQKAAEHGDLEAMYQLGTALVQMQKFSDATRWLFHAASRGHGDAACDLGEALLAAPHVGPGEGTEGTEYLQKAAAGGNAKASYILGKMYESGRGVPKDVLMARTCYVKAAAEGNTSAEARLNSFSFVFSIWTRQLFG